MYINWFDEMSIMNEFNSQNWQKTQSKLNKEKQSKYKTIEVTLDSGDKMIWDASKGEWNDYEYRDTIFIVKKDGVWIGVYNINYVVSIIVK